MIYLSTTYVLIPFCIYFLASPFSPPLTRGFKLVVAFTLGGWGV